MFVDLIEIHPGLLAHASGALWIEEIATAVIADLHLGYSWAQRRRGELGPLADERTRAKLLAMRDSLRPRQIVFLGDVVHAPRSCVPEREWIEGTMRDLSATSGLVVVRGNHDRRFASEFSELGCQTVESFSHASVTMVHGDRWNFHWPEGHMLVLGHIHPSLSVRDASGARHKLPVFVAGKRCMVLPAFSPFARGYNMACGIPSELARHLCESEAQTYAVTGKRVVPLGLLSAAIEKICENDTSSAAQFRRRQPRRAASG